MEKLSEKLINLIADLGHEAALDPRFTELKAKADAYMADSTLKSLIEEYNIQQAALATVSTQGTADGNPAEMRKVIEERLEALYDSIVDNPAYRAYVSAKETYDEYYNAILEELQFAITGTRPSTCTHDCSSCGGHCH